MVEKVTTQSEKISGTLVVDASNQIAGRLASRVAKELLSGARVSVVNAERAVISGNPKHVIAKFDERRKRGDPYHGPFFPRTPDRILKRIIRGMIPHKTARGRAAMKRLRVFISEPEELKGRGVKIVTEHTPEKKFITVGDLAIKIGAKRTW